MMGANVWEVPMQEGVHSCQNSSQIPKENPWKPEVPRDSLSHRELWTPGGGHETKPKGLMPHSTHAPDSSAPWAGGKQPSAYCRGLRGGPGIRQNRGQVWARTTHRQPRPGSGQGRHSWAAPPTLHTKHTKIIITTISINKMGQIQPWQQ